ncbi:hypothetical protein Tco_0442815 [Tanacetum coccineum]
MSFSRFFFSVTLIASSSSKSSSTKGDVLKGGGVLSNVTLSDSSTFLVRVVEEYGRIHKELELKSTLEDIQSSNGTKPKDVEPEPNLPLQEIIILDPDDQPMWENAKIVALTANSAIVQPNVDDNFVIISTHLKMI